MSPHATVVRYYPPFAHYSAADSVRVALAAGSAGVGLLVLLIAWRRWREDRRSATVFLAGIALSMSVHSAASLVALGHPPVWWLLLLRCSVVATAAVGCWLTVREARRGIWARRA